MRALIIPCWFALTTMICHGAQESVADLDDELDRDALAPASNISADDSSAERALSPTALAASADGRFLWIGCATANQVLRFDLASERVVNRIEVPASPLELALSGNGERLYITCAAASSILCVVDTTANRNIQQIGLGHTALGPVLSPDEKTLYVCNRFDDDVSIIDLIAGREVQRIPVEREPISAAITPDGKWLIVANHLHAGPADTVHAPAKVSIIDLAIRRLVKHVALTEGSSLVRGVAVSPDGLFAAVAHLRSQFWLGTTGVELGRMNANALSILDVLGQRMVGTLLLDQTTRGAANPWAVIWPDSRTIVVSHAGTHELSVVDVPVDMDSRSFMNLILSSYSRRSEERR